MKRTVLFKTKLNGITVENDGQSVRYSSGSQNSKPLKAVQLGDYVNTDTEKINTRLRLRIDAKSGS